MMSRFLVLVLSCFVGSLLCAQELVYGFRHYPPLAYLDQQGKPTGSYIDGLVKPMRSRSGLNITLKQFPVKRLYHGLETGDVDIIICPKLGVIKPDIAIWGNVPVVEDEIALYSYLPITQVSSIDDLQNRSLGGVRGYTFAGRIKDIKNPKYNIRFHSANSHLSLFKMLKVRRLEFVLAYTMPANKALAQVKLAQINQRTLFHVQSFFAVSVRHKDAQNILDKMDQALVHVLTNLGPSKNQ